MIEEVVCMGNRLDDTTRLGSGWTPCWSKRVVWRDAGMQRFLEMEVYVPISHGQALQDLDMKIVGVRWVKVNERTRLHLIRCRLLAQEFADTKQDVFFAGTPPLLAL